jgi:hypothetical protein
MLPNNYGEIMNLTNCPDCNSLCFIEFTSCQGCGHEFQAGLLKTKADAEDKAFMRKYNALFLTTILILLGVLVFVLVGGYSKV